MKSIYKKACIGAIVLFVPGFASAGSCQKLMNNFYTLFAKTPVINAIFNGFPSKSLPVRRRVNAYDIELWNKSVEYGSEFGRITFIDPDGGLLYMSPMFSSLKRGRISSEYFLKYIETGLAYLSKERTSGLLFKIIATHTHPDSGVFSAGDQESSMATRDIINLNFKNVLYEEQIVYFSLFNKLKKKAFVLR